MATATETAAPVAGSAPAAMADTIDTAEALEDALNAARADFVARHAASKALHETAAEVLPGGNTRTVLFSEPFPVVMKRGEENRLWDHDGQEYLDLVGELTAGLYGHSHPVLRAALVAAFDGVGVNLGATMAEEAQFARLLCDRFPALEQVRFCNSGTEANLYALALARHATGRHKVVVFDGAYHGGVLTGFGGASLPANVVDRDDWIVAPYNDVAAVQVLFRSPAVADTAAVIVEAMQGAGGCIPATPAFLEAVQTESAKAGVLFVLDEVMTSRLHPRGLAGRYGLAPDLVTLGKYLGGGLAFGAFGGRRALMQAYSPLAASAGGGGGGISHSGTFNNNSLMLATGYAGLASVYTLAAAEALNALGDRFRAQLQAVGAGSKMVVTGVGAALTVHFMRTGQPPATAADITDASRGRVPALQKLFWFWCIARGFWITERGMLSIVLGTTAAELDGFVVTVAAFRARYQHLLVVE